MSWRNWFPGRDPDTVGVRQIYAEAARRALDENRCQVAWLATSLELPEHGRVQGFADRETRRVYAPLPASASDLSVLLHEVGHHAATNGFSGTYLEREMAAGEWSVRQARKWALPDLHIIEFAAAQSFRTAVRKGLRDGSVTLSEARTLVPADLRDLFDLDSLKDLELVA